MSHFLQGPDWEAFQRKLGRKVVRRSGEGWELMAVLEKGRIASRLYVPYGPTVESPDALARALAALRQLAKETGGAFVRIEPMGPVTVDDVRALGGVPVDYTHVQPDRTQVVDLSGTPDELIAGLKQSNRSIVRNFAKKGVEVTTSQDPADAEVLLGFLHEVSERNAVALQPDDYLRTQAEALFERGAATLYVAQLDGQPIAAAMCYDGDDTRYYAHAGADTEHRKLNAATILIGRMMLDAQADGKRWFDLYGIGPEGDPDHAWSGFTAFKQGFGGTSIDYVGAWDIPVHRVRYDAYRLLLAGVERAQQLRRRAGDVLARRG